MLIEKHGNCTVFATGRWDEFLREYRQAPQSRRLLLPDKRPAILRPPHDGDDQPNYLTVHPLVWQAIKPQLAQRMRLMIHPKRHRLCQACGASMRVAQETDQTWSFRCDVCKSLEIHGKNIVGGVIGAGEKEKS